MSLSFLPHGIPEIAGYLLAGLAGGVISAAIIRGRKMDLVMRVVIDAGKLFGLAVLFVFLGAVIETAGMMLKVASLFIFYTMFIYLVTIAMSSSTTRNTDVLKKALRPRIGGNK